MLRRVKTVSALLLAAAFPVFSAPSLSVDQAIHTAVEFNPRYRSTLKLVQSSEAQVNQAKAPYYPTLDLSFSNNQSNTGVIASGATVVTGNGGSQRLSASSLNLNYTILDFGRRHLTMRSFESQLEVSRQSSETIRQDVILQVRQQFYLTHTDQEALRIQEEQVKNQRHHLRQAQGYYKAGLQARNEVTKAASDLANAELTLVQAKNTLELDWVSLNVNMGLPRNTAYELQLAPVEQEFLDLIPENVVELAYLSRPEAHQVRAQIESTLYQMEAQYANRYPTLSASAGTGVRGADLPLPYFWTVGMVLNLNIFNGYLDRHAADSLRFQAEALAEQLEQTQQQIYKEVMSAYLTLVNARSAIIVSRSNLSSSQDNYRLADQRYTAGLGSNLEYQDAQVILVRSRIGEVTAQNNYRTAVAQLCRAAGVVSVAELKTAPPPSGGQRIFRGSKPHE